MQAGSDPKWSPPLSAVIKNAVALHFTLSVQWTLHCAPSMFTSTVHPFCIYVHQTALFTLYVHCTCTQSNSAALSAGGETQKQAEVHCTELLAPLHSIISTTAQNYQHHFSPFYSGARQADWLLVKLGSKKCILRPLALLLLSVSADSLSFAK